MDLFDAVKNKEKSLSEYLRPKTLQDVAGQEHLLSPNKPFRLLLESDRLNSIIIFGPPGTGKTTISRIYASMTGAPFVYLNAALCGTNDLKNAANYPYDKKPVVFIDEIHRFNKAQQDVLLPYIEDGKIRFIGATTHNPLIYVVPALRSRSMIFELKHIEEEQVKSYIKKLFNENIILNYLKSELSAVEIKSVRTDEKVIEYLAKACGGDIRILVNILEMALITRIETCKKNNFEAAAGEPKDEICLALEEVEAVLPAKLAFYDKDQDEHYNTISAFIKSVRGSDAQAAVYYLAKMLIGGEDPRFIARRLIILASEDIGMADPRGLQIASDALLAVENIGMPEARIVLAQATIYLATAPKSNSAYLAIDRAMAFCEKNPNIEIPRYLKNVKLDDKNSPDYKYPHNYPKHYVKQRYMCCDEVFYEPVNIGYEAKVNAYIKEVTSGGQLNR